MTVVMKERCSEWCKCCYTGSNEHCYRLHSYFMISLIIQQLYREILSVADEQGGKLKNRCVFFADEFGTLPKIESAEMMFSASRSRRLQIVPIIQSFSQLDKNYGKEGAEIIVDNTQLTLFGGFAPNSASAETLSKALGSRTVMSGTVSRSKNDPSQSLQMLTTDDFNGEDILVDTSQEIDDAVIHKIMLDKLRDSFVLLSDEEQKLIHEIYFNGLSERNLAEKSGVSQVAIHKRKIKILDKLKKIIEK